MRALVQRVTRASVRVDDELVGEIGPGLCILVGVTHDDTPADAEKLAAKVHGLRVFDDESGQMNLSLEDTGGAALVVSQFTLYGDTRKGRRPSWVGAAAPELAEPLIAGFVDALRVLGTPVEMGRFRADMAVELVNDGPVTLLIEVPSR
jgi:D-tyrosyl-tRNA(Tyr) deacylase